MPEATGVKVNAAAVQSRGESFAANSKSTEPAALVVCHEVHAGASPLYEDWLRSVRVQCRSFAGHLGAEVIRPAAGSATYTVIVRFDSIDHLDAWLASSERKAAIEAIQPILSRGDQRTVQAGFDHWFTPTAALPAPKRHKQYLVMVSAVFPLSLCISLALEWALPAIGLQTNAVVLKLLTALLMVALMVWVVFPVITTHLSRWLTR